MYIDKNAQDLKKWPADIRIIADLVSLNITIRAPVAANNKEIMITSV